MVRKSDLHAFRAPLTAAPRHGRLPVDIRVEIANQADWLTARSLSLGLDGISIQSGEGIPAGSTLNVLLYLPRGEEVDLVRVQSRTTECVEEQGLYDIAAAFKRFAPGDERRLSRWLADTVRQREPTRH